MAKQEDIKKTDNVEVENTTSTESPMEDTKEEVVIEENVAEKKVKKDKDVIAEKIFDKNAECKVLYKASDGTYFLEELDAKNYAVRLKDKEVLTIKRKEDVTES